MQMIENRMVVDSEFYYMEKENTEPGCFDQWGTFVKEENLLEVALEEVQTCNLTRERFLDLVCDYIESNKEAAEQFLKWYYPDYKEE